MKQINLALACCAAFGISGSAMAQTTFSGNANVTSAECVLLAEAVVLGASSGVTGAYLCEEATNLVQVGACHAGGSRQGGVACVDTDPLTAGNQVPVGSGCTDDDVAAGRNAPNPSYKAFFTSSEGGVIQEQPLTGRCEASTLSALPAWGG
ncbi:hypothetical protein IAI53_15080 [Thauera sp. CAU 1555]|uniref:Secreted protein n=1 Tax=Thauera sedimentorum TaxID=2767595 RepID=A0ABR9BDX8_9RHOO|nr:hypothetical protein [Thauera sedimentorum]MBC9073299.1 hypothetical protein [Thauera sedimentorum]MBD8504218.1 hypothetical protein [Thauera sedimentorum]